MTRTIDSILHSVALGRFEADGWMDSRTEWGVEELPKVEARFAGWEIETGLASFVLGLVRYRKDDLKY